MYITPGNKERMNQLDKNGHKRHWILEVHLRPASNEYGAFFEQILTADKLEARKTVLTTGNLVIW